MGAINFSELTRPMAGFQLADSGELIEKLIYHPSLVLLFAPSGGQKSLFALDLARSVALGDDFLGYTTVQKNVLYLDGEMSDRSIKLRADEMGIVDIPESQLGYLTPQDQQLDFSCEETQQEFLGFIKDSQYDVVVFDNLRVLYGTDNENDAACFHSFNGFIRRIRALGRSVLVIHHSNKDGEKFAGSSNILTVFDIVLGLRGLASCNHKQLDLVKLRDETDFRKLANQYVTFEPDGFKLNSTVGVDLESVVNSLLRAVAIAEVTTISAARDFLRLGGVPIDNSGWNYEVLYDRYVRPYGSESAPASVSALKDIFAKARERLRLGEIF